jgi:UDP-N-acetyl-D-glucosamine dehydrogenase
MYALVANARSFSASRIQTLAASARARVTSDRASCPISLQSGTARARAPYVPSPGDLGLCSVPFEDALTGVELALIVTAHPGVDHELIASRAPAVLDLRGVLSGVRASHVMGL